MQNDFSIFDIKDETDFENAALNIFRFQAVYNQVYQRFLNYLKVEPNQIDCVQDIPFLPIEFFKTYQVVSQQGPYEAVFMSSGTTGMQRSRHYVKNLDLYETSFLRAFKTFYGDIKDYTIVALLPSYIEQGHSSLVYMVHKLINLSEQSQSGFYLNDADLPFLLNKLDASQRKTLLVGVSYALLDLVQKHSFDLSHTIIMETGGMKGRRKEMLREELHQHLKRGFGVTSIHSEYGMTELLSQSYSQGNGIFESPAWQKILIRDTEDPFTYLPTGKTGGINVIDLANINSCAFIATQDLGKKVGTQQFEILGRFDHSDVRGCNLLLL